MDEPANQLNQLQKILDSYPIENPLLPFEQQENSYNLEPFSIFGISESKNQYFFSPHSPKVINNIRPREEPQYFSDRKVFKSQPNQFFYSKKLNFNQFQSTSNVSDNQKNSSDFYEQNEDLVQQIDKKEINHNTQKLRNSPKRQFSSQQIKSNNIHSSSLKSLAKLMLKIVTDNRFIAFPEVIQRLIQDFKRKLDSFSQEETEIKLRNVKRRVYDALNVLISSSVLEKNGKILSLVKEKRRIVTRRQVLSTNQRKRQQEQARIYQILQQRVSLQQMLLEVKRKSLTTLQQRKSNLHQFFTTKHSTHPSPSPTQTINFPFVCIRSLSSHISQIHYTSNCKHQSIFSLQKQENSSTCDSYREEEKTVRISFSTSDFLRNVQIDGDIDVAEEVGRMRRGRLQEGMGQQAGKKVRVVEVKQVKEEIYQTEKTKEFDSFFLE